MKKVLICILTLCFLFAVLCSCNHLNQNISDATNSKFSGVIETPSEQQSSCNYLNQDKAESTNSKFSGVIETPPAHQSYHFGSYQEVVRALTQKNSSRYSTLREEQVDCGTVYQNTLSKFANGDIKVAIPKFGENAMPLQNKDGYSTITLMTSELYNLPWLWYHCIVNNQKVTVSVSYLDAIYNVESSQTTYAQILKSLAPGAPSPENYQKYGSYKTIYEKNIVLKDGVSVTAMISEIKDNSKEYVMFYYDGLLVVLYGNCELFSDNFWESFSITYN